MERNVIFLSYSRADAALRDIFVKHLRAALPPDSPFELFVDIDIEPGTKWNDEINEALDRTVLGIFLVSVDLIVSPFVRETEIPRLVGAKEAGLAEIGVLFARPANTAGSRVQVEGKNGSVVSVDLRDYQALTTENRPDRALSAIRPNSTLESVLAEAAHNAVKLAETQAARAAALAAPPPSARNEDLALEVRIVRAASGASQLTYLRNGQRLFDEVLPGPLPDLDRDEQLFHSLFPKSKSSDTWRRVAWELDRTGGTSPAGLALRLTIVTDDPDLLAARWPEMSHDGFRLADHHWTVVLRTPNSEFRTRAELSTGASIVIGIADPEGDLGGAAHRLAARKPLTHEWGSAKNVLVRQKREEVVAAVRAHVPGLVYLYGRAQDQGQDQPPALVFADGFLTADALVAAWSNGAPTLVYATLFGVSAKSAARFGRAIASKIPLAIIRAADPTDLDKTEGDPRTIAVATLSRLAGGGTWNNPRFLVPASATCEMLFWNTQELAVGQFVRHHGEHQKIARLLLDRTHQREAVQGAARDMMRQGRRVDGLIAHAKAGNLLEAFGEQAENYLFENSEDVPFSRIPIDLSRMIGFNEQALRRLLLEQLDCDDDGLTSGLRRAAPRKPGTHRSLLLLDFGVLDPSEGPPIRDALTRWVSVLRHDVASQCPEGIVVLCLWSIHEENVPELESIVQEVATESFDDVFALTALPRLDLVQPSDIVKYLHVHSGMPKNLRYSAAEIATQLRQVTSGVFDPLVRWLDRLQRNWIDELGRLFGKGSKYENLGEAEDETF